MRAVEGQRAFRIFRTLFGLLLLAALVYYVDPKSLLPVLSQLQALWLVVMAVAIAVATFVGAGNLFLLFELGRRPRFADFLPLYWISWAVGLVVPGQVGDVASVTVLLHRRGYSWRSILGRSLLDKFLSFAVLAAFALVGLSRWIGIGRAALTGIALAGLASGGLILAPRYLSSIARSGGLVGKWCELVRSLVADIRTFCLEFPLRVAINLLLTAVKTLLVGVSYWVVFRALGVGDISVWEVVPLMAASSLVAYLPISFNGIGTVEAAGLVIFGSLGLSHASVLAAYLALRSVVLILAWIPAAIWLSLRRKEPADRALC